MGPVSTITTAAELDALPARSVVLDAHGRAFQKFALGWEATGLVGAHDVVARPATVLHRPDAEIEPQRVQPSTGSILAAIEQSWSDALEYDLDSAVRAVQEVYAAQPTVAAVLRKASDDLLADMDHFPAAGRHTRAWWAVNRLLTYADREAGERP